MREYIAEQGATLGIQALGIAPPIDEVRALHPWARSVVCAAVSYLPPDPGPVPEGIRGLVARVARGADYHDVVRAKLTRLADALRSRMGTCRMEIHLDTSPLPERKLAAMSGIGWLGKNCCLYVDGCGSYVALGEIVTSIPLPPTTSQQPSRCGDCTLCLDSCPAHALTAPGVLDRSRCLSSLTQSGGSIPGELQKAMENRIYGCDICQEVCPHNQGLTPVNTEFAVSEFPGPYPELLPLLIMTRSNFEALVRPSSIGWIGRSRLRRNAAIAIMNAGGAAADGIKEILDSLAN